MNISLGLLNISDGGNARSPVNLIADGGAGGDGGYPANRGAGGAGGAGGTGGSVNLSVNSGSITSNGAGVSAIKLQANGGNGGNARPASTGTDKAYGKEGGAGGSAGTIKATFTGTITSAGGGVYAESIGGSGGNGGDASTSSPAGAQGGNGGIGGTGGSVSLTLAGGSVTAKGAAAPATGRTQATPGGGTIKFSAPVAALQAYVGGGTGGNGGTGVGGFGKGSGGGGGRGGFADPAAIENRGGAIVTTGYAAAGMLAQNIGGGGGNGAYGGGVFVGSGGGGSPGGDAGSALVTAVGGSTRTSGDGSVGMAAESIGGGGGYGGDANVAGIIAGVTVGGNSENGGAGSLATVFNGLPTNSDRTDYTGGQLIVTSGARSAAILAQSVGGGGGVAGDSTSLVVGGVFSVAVGGRAGTGGAGGFVSVGNGGVIQTGGAGSNGIDAQSVGGGGGDGGAANSLLIGAQLTVSSAVGGNGGTGGAGGGVAVANSNQIVTNGANSFGIYAQSVGGGGGHGGTSLSRTIQVYNDPRFPSVNLNASIGGSGGSGNIAGTVAVGNSGAVATTGSGAAGIIAQSVGGGGGNGGDADALNQALQSANVSATVVIGGAGGSGGNGGAVFASNSGLVYTLNNDAHAIIAQSVGGGGGTGGYGENNTGAVRPSDKSVQMSLALGGVGGASGNGGNVNVDNTSGGIFTIGNKSFGVLAQSVGGGGGDGGGAVDNAGGGGKVNINVAVGGGGGAGGTGGKVTVTNNAAIVTLGGSSTAVYAQSIGGGGGVGGDAAIGTGTDPLLDAAEFIKNGMGIGALTSSPDGTIYVLTQLGGEIFNDVSLIEKAVDSYLAVNPIDPKEKKASVGSQIDVNIGGGVAGRGGAAGAGGEVSITNAGNIETKGAFSEGVFAQSVGGGGGNGGAAESTNASSIINGSFGVGGAGGSSGIGGPVSITNTGSIVTRGDIAFGVFGQSVGGGGGKGGVTIGDPEMLTNITVNIGGSGGANGNGGVVAVNSSGGLTTAGRDATAIVAQSIGGGGGIQGLMTIGDPATGGSGHSQSGDIPHSALIPITVGGANGASGNGGPVTANVAGAVNTQGSDAYGVLAQSIGGGGGLVAGVPGKGSVTTPDGAFGGGNLSGNGGAVRVTLSGAGNQINTAGAGAAAILAQSLGGGGAIIGGLSQVDLRRPAMGPNPALHSGQGGDISIDMGARTIISTNGVGAPGIFAQSAGGGGGLYGHADGSGFPMGGGGSYACGSSCSGQVTINVSGRVITYGAQSHAIYASSRGNGRNGVSISVNNGTLAANGPNAAAIYIDSPNGTNNISNTGYIGANSGIAVDGNSRTTIVNFGTMTGNILSSLPNAYTITNNATGRIYTGSIIASGGTVNSAGELFLDKGGANRQTTITSSLISTGRIISSANFGSGQADQLIVQGTATVSGQVFINPLAIQSGSVTVLRANSLSVGSLAVTNYAYNLQNDVITPVVPLNYYYTYSTTPTTLTVNLVPQFNFAGVGGALSTEEKSVGLELQELATATSASAASPVLAAIYGDITSFAQYQAALDYLGAHAYAELGVTRSAEERAFAQAMITCHTPTGGSRPSVETDCFWGRASGGWLERDSSQDDHGFHLRSERLELGGQKELGNGWFVGGGLSYSDTRLRENTGTVGVSGDTIQAGAFAKRKAGRLTFSLAATAGAGWYHSNRIMEVGTVTERAAGSPRLQHVGGHARADYEINLGSALYLKPVLDLAATYVHASSFNEHGSVFALDVATAQHTTFAASPKAELGGRFEVSEGTWLWPHVEVGGTFYSGNHWTTGAYFVGAEKLSEPFSTRVRLPARTKHISGGVEILTRGRLGFSLAYDGELSSGYAAHSGSLKLAFSF